MAGTVSNRNEEGFMLVNIRWGNTISVSNELGNFLMKYMESQKSFSLKEFGEENMEWLANWFFKDVVVADNYDFKDDRSLMGVSANIDQIPFIKEINKSKLNYQKVEKKSFASIKIRRRDTDPPVILARLSVLIIQRWMAPHWLSRIIRIGRTGVIILAQTMSLD